MKKIKSTNPRKGKITMTLWVTESEKRILKSNVDDDELGKLIGEIIERGDLT